MNGIRARNKGKETKSKKKHLQVKRRIHGCHLARSVRSFYLFAFTVCHGPKRTASCFTRTRLEGSLDYGINRLAVFIPGSVFLLIVNVLFASKRVLLDLTA